MTRAEDEQQALSAETIEWARSLTGTYYADSTTGYYTAMNLIFDVAREAVAPTDLPMGATAHLRGDAGANRAQEATRGQVAESVQGVLFNVSNYPESVQRHLLGKSTHRLLSALTDALLARFDIRMKGQH